MAYRFWTDAEVAELRRRYPNERTQDIADDLGRKLQALYTKAQSLGLSKSPEFLASAASGRMVAGTDGARRIGAATRFHSDQTPWNKGRPYRPGGRSPETQFQPGQKPHNAVPIGTYRIQSDGYLQVKVRDTGYHVTDWEFVHRRVWEAANGPIPHGHVVVFRGPRTTVLEEITLDRLELISRIDLMRRNTIHRYPPELKSAMRTLGRLKGAIRKKEQAG